MNITRRGMMAAIAAAIPALGARRIPLGFTLYGMRSMPLDEALAACERIGYDAVELALMPGWPTEPKLLDTAARRNLRAMLQNRRLELAALMENLVLLADEPAHQENLERLRKACALAHDLNPNTPPVIETILGNRPGQWDDVRNRMAERLGTWARIMEEHRGTLAIKPHIGNAMQTPEATVWLLDQVRSKAVTAVYDHGHFEAQGMTIEATMKVLLPRTTFIHIKDSVTEGGQRRWVLPGEGSIDYAEYARLLDHHRYYKPVVIEVSSQIFNKPGYDPVRAAETAYKYMKPFFGSRESATH